MATYLPGSQDYIPQIQPFVPDYNFYAGALQMKQGQADQARQQLSTLYGSLLNAPLTRDDNVARRDGFFKTIERDIQRIAGMDLSKRQNVVQAEGLFNQLIDDKSIVHDMVWTRGFQKELQRAQNFKNCGDPEKCGGSWWEGGERLMQYSREEYRNAPWQDAMKMSHAQFTPHQDVSKQAIALAKEAGLSVKVDELKGGYITTTKNGSMLVTPLQQLFMGSLAQDPAIQSYYKAQAELARKDFMYTNAERYGSVEAAEQAYIAQTAPVVEALLKGSRAGIEESISNTKKKTEKLEEEAKKGIKEDQSYLAELIGEYRGRQEKLEKSLEVAKATEGEVAVAGNYSAYTGRQIDNILAMTQLGVDIDNSAKALAYKDYEYSIAVDQYSMEAVKQKNRIRLENMKHSNQIALADHKFDLEQAAEQQNMEGLLIHNAPRIINDIPGGIVTGDSNPHSQENLERGMNAFVKDRDGTRADLSAGIKWLTQNALQRGSAAADNGDVQAKEDYVRLVEEFANARNIAEQNVAFNQPYSEVTGKAIPPTVNNKLESAISVFKNANTLDQKYAAAKRVSGHIDLDQIPGSQIDQIYEKVLSKMLDPKVKENKVMREYLTPLRKNAAKNGVFWQIQARDLALQQMDNMYAEQAKSVIGSARMREEFGDTWADAFASYIDPNGYVVDENTFISNMRAKGYDPEVASNLYKMDVKEPKGWDLWNRAFGSAQKAKDIKTQNKAKGEGIHQKWKRAVAMFAKPQGDKVWLVSGAGDKVARGQNYVADPQFPASPGLQGSVGIIRDALHNQQAVFSMGGFSESLPETEDDAAVIAKTLLTDLYTMQEDKDRPILDVTYSHIAASREDMVGLNIKLNPSYTKKYKGTENNKGLMPDQAALTSEGLTIYVPKNETHNTFTEGTKGTALDKSMQWGGPLKLDHEPDYAKNFTITPDPNTGAYNVSGMIRSGHDDEGDPNWEYFSYVEPNDINVTDMVIKYQNFIDYVVEQHQAYEQRLGMKNKSNAAK